MGKKKVVEYLKEGSSVFGNWFHGLDAHAAAKVTTALYRLEQGNFSNVKSVGESVSEYKIDFGPGLRIYFGQDGDELVILLEGGKKKMQGKDIREAQMLWAQYKSEKKQKK
ncbi:MAG: addiction module protein [Nitrospirae bacterium CG_4_10_14_0_8_um_filter_41_23]|nr:type II toxin-antitoxin system RelE/ParE family toxin [Nitrospirota bacterium]OIP61520.1 MAG: addiction module protein [Nitrospirae bacterium CG2_30_41_42]PIQ95134.1 MAG: addiction module protein [Nitrospirae bacterium CG11_big_fil_rev_8_21_14_0_20_41_14]PIV43261.1 MAG: addiction module protein [Nitrospirae bacterium CG02_land_8_20_14_3_00_41_53]PIW86306.1 MAG: addiction module protein [Nitrospirae bacterium CG_4_8_14_3_um_filter_41_47]PIY87340.1 MAG: addiction module protein [Nitrospirae b